MCGRYTVTVSWSELRQRFQAEGPGHEPAGGWQPRFNAAPGQQLPVVVFARPEGRPSDPPRRELRLLRWGLVPTWAKEPTLGAKTINARSETASEKPTFRSAFRSRRCLVPADSFYEWQKVGGRKQPLRILPDEHSAIEPGAAPLFAFAGLWENGTFTVLTRAADAGLSAVHDRMPVILASAQEEKLWLESSSEALGHLHDLLAAPAPERHWRLYPVSTRLNSPAHDDASLVAPESGSQVGQEAPDAQPSLFDEPSAAPKARKSRG